MAFADVVKRILYPAKTSARFKRLDAYDRLREGTAYDHIRIPFHTEYGAGGTYIPIMDRRPSVIWDGARMLVDQLSGLMWGDEQMPIVRTYYGEEPADADRVAETSIQHLVELLDLDAVMDDVTEKASSGSAAIIIRATDDKEPYIEVIPGKECTPTFDPRNPFTLIKLERLYPTKGEDLAEMGYDIPDGDAEEDYWFRLVIDKTSETRYLPMKADRYERLGQKDDHGVIIAWQVDEENSDEHGWPCINVIWAKAPKGNRIDGDCLYGAHVADLFVAIDYGLSQVGRGYRYTADPMLMIRRGEIRNGAAPASQTTKNQTQKDSQGKIVKGPQNVLDLEVGGDAKMLEISGQGLSAYTDYVKLLREWGLEICGGMKSDAGTTKGVESGRALEILYQSLILVMKRWRVALGNKAFLPIVRLLLVGIAADLIEVEGVESVDPDTTMRLVWPQWMTPSGTDLNADTNAWQTLAGGSQKVPVAILPRSAVTRLAATNLGMNDVSALIDELDKQQTDDDAKAQQQADQQHAQALAVQATKAATLAE
jgi:hypothetical protein